MKKYKAIIFDIDGTLVPNKKEGSPSKGVIEAIEKASHFIHISIATSRPYFLIKNIVKYLNLNGPSIINGGAQIIDLTTQKILWRQCIDRKDVLEICRILQNLKITFQLMDNGINHYFDENYIVNKPFCIWIHPTKPEITEKIIDKITHIPTISALKIPSWEKEKIDILVTHASATKQHAVFEIAKILKIKTDEIIGVGDGYNDFPLLMACGLKVAMGNGVEDLKSIADYIAPTVDEDGAAHVINKFILNHE